MVVIVRPYILPIVFILKFIQNLLSIISYNLIALTHVFNLSLACGEFISDFKTAKVAPIHKK